LGFTHFLEWYWQWNPDPHNLDRARELAQQALALDDASARAHRLLGRVLLWKGQYQQAIAEGERAIALDPNSADGRALLAEFLNFAGRAVEALERVEQAMRLNPLYPEWYLFQLGWAYRITGRFQEAIAAQKQVLVRNPNFQDAYTELVLNSVLEWTWQLSPDLQTLDQAFEAAQRAVHLNESWTTAHAALSLVSVWQKQHERALAEGERALALGINEGEGYAIVAEVLNFAGRPHKTIELMEKAPCRDYPYAYSSCVSQLGFAYYLVGRTEEAIAPLKEASTRSSTHLGAHVVLAAAYGELGRQGEALAEVAAVRKLSPHFSLEVWGQRLPFADQRIAERFLTALRNAGMK